MIRIALVYRRPVCGCGSRMVTHVEQSGVWRFGCSSCKTEIPRAEIVKVENEEWFVAAKEQDKS